MSTSIAEQTGIDKFAGIAAKIQAGADARRKPAAKPVAAPAKAAPAPAKAAPAPTVAAPIKTAPAVTAPPAARPAGDARAFLAAFDSAFTQSRTIEAAPAAFAKLRAARAALDMSRADSWPAGFRTFLARCDHHIAQAAGSQLKYAELRAFNALGDVRSLVSPK
jgi:hypothetical protein